VRRRPLGELVYGDGWGVVPDWAVDPDGTTHTQAGPPKGAKPLGTGSPGEVGTDSGNR